MVFNKDMSKPDGEACNADGTLKDATEIEWINSPLDIIPPPPQNIPFVSGSCAWNGNIERLASLSLDIQI